MYKGLKLDCGYRLDVVVADCVVIELKSVEQILPIHHAQLLTYLRLSGKRVGLLINFNVSVLRMELSEESYDSFSPCLCVSVVKTSFYELISNYPGR